jgi:hypothetical protein
MTRPAEVRARLVDILRRDLVGPGSQDDDLQHERLGERPSRWYLTGFIAPADEEPAEDDPAAQEDEDREAQADLGAGAGGAAGNDGASDAPAARRRFLPSSVGLTVLLPVNVETIEARIGWGDYVTEPPLPEGALLEREDGEEPAPRHVDWARVPQQRSVMLTIPTDPANPSARQWVPDSSASQIAGGGSLQLTVHARAFEIALPDGQDEHVRAVTVFLVNRRAPVKRRYADVGYTFQARLELVCREGFRARYDLSGYRAADEDLRLADLHYRDVEEYAVGRNAAAAWKIDEDGVVRRVCTDHLPVAEVERVAPNEDISGVEFGMEALAGLAAQDGDVLAASIASLPVLYDAWITAQRNATGPLPLRRRETAERLIQEFRLMRAGCPEAVDGEALPCGGEPFHKGSVEALTASSHFACARSSSALSIISRTLRSVSSSGALSPRSSSARLALSSRISAPSSSR